MRGKFTVGKGVAFPETGSITWGDGHADRRVHVITDIDIDRGVIGCRCGAAIPRGEHITLETAWEVHRGHKDFRPTVYQASELATDAEVQLFMDENLGDVVLGERARMRRVPGGSGISDRPPMTEDALDAAFESLEALRMMQERCTCDTTSVWECPNYVEGDEDE